MISPDTDFTPRSLSFSAASAIAASIVSDEFDAISDLRDQEEMPVPKVEGYDVIKSMGSGASGHVYYAIRKGSGKPVAIKFYKGHFDDGIASQRALRELDLLSAIRHPQIVKVQDFGVLDTGQLWMATELIGGQLLDKYCSSTTTSLRSRIKTLAEICDAVQAIHEFGVIHRDLKPNNVLIDRHGKPVIIDLGIASFVDIDTHADLTQDGVPIGTPGFMSPEQFLGQRESISTRSDIYSLGVIGYAFLASDVNHTLHRQSHLGNDAALADAVRQIGRNNVRSLRELVPGLPRSLELVLAKAVQHSPSSRYESAAALAADLRRFLAGERVEAAPPGIWNELVRWIGRHPILATTFLSLIIASSIVVGTAFATWYLNNRPYQIVVDAENRQWVRLVSATGKELASWHSLNVDGVETAKVAELPPALGGGKVILTVIRGYENDDFDVNLDQQLCVWDFENPTKLLWHTRPGRAFIQHPGGELPPLTSRDVQTLPESYFVGEVLVCDVFSESPGDELVVVHSHHSVDPQAIRVYDLAGSVLYEAWHWGSVTRLYWINDPGVVVCKGMSNVAAWTHLGYDNVNLRFPQVLFTLAPEFDRELGWINVPGAEGGADLRFYKYLWPPEATDLFYIDFLPLSVPELRDSSVDVVLRVGDTEAKVHWSIDAEGNPVTPEPLSNDFFKDLADPPRWEFVDELPLSQTGANAISDK